MAMAWGVGGGRRGWRGGGIHLGHGGRGKRGLVRRDSVEDMAERTSRWRGSVMAMGRVFGGCEVGRMVTSSGRA